MNKWFHPFGLLLLAAMIGDLSGCAQTSGWLVKKPEKNSDDEKIADKKSSAKKAADKKLADKKASTKKAADKKAIEEKLAEKSAKKNSSKDLADTKSSSSKNGDTANKSKAKDKDLPAEQDKLAAADRPKKSKPSIDSTAEKDKADLLADSKSDKPPKAKQPAKILKSDDDLDSLMAARESSASTAKKATKPSSIDEFDPLADDEITPKKNVVQVKTEVAKNAAGDDDEEWMTTKSEPESKGTKKQSVAESFEEELESPFAAKNSTISRESQPAASEDTPESYTASVKRNPVKKETSNGLLALCPNADGELIDLLKRLDPADPESLKQGLHRIGQMGNDGTNASPLLWKMLKHENAFVRIHSALAMARLQISSPESVAVVIDSLKSRDASLRSFGVAVLGEMGPRTDEVLTALAENLKDRDGQVRLRAAEVLIRHDRWAYPALQAELTCLRDKDENVRWLAAYSLAELAPEESPEVVQALLKAAHDHVKKVQVGAVYALGEIGPYARRSVGELRRLLESTDDEELRSAITYSLQQIEKESP